MFREKSGNFKNLWLWQPVQFLRVKLAIWRNHCSCHRSTLNFSEWLVSCRRWRDLKYFSWVCSFELNCFLDGNYLFTDSESALLHLRETCELSCEHHMKKLRIFIKCRHQQVDWYDITKPTVFLISNWYVSHVIN